MKLTKILLISQIIFILLLGVTTNKSINEIVTCESQKTGVYNMFFKTSYTAILNDPKLLGFFKGRCFQRIYPSMVENDDSFEVTLFSTKSLSFFCSDLIIITTGKTSSSKFMMMQGHHKFHLVKSKMSEAEINYIRKRGVKIMKNCSNLSSYPRHIFNLAKMFFGGFTTHPSIPIFGSKTPDYQINENRKLIKEYTGYDFERRETLLDINLAKSKIKSGDYLGLTRFDGLDQLIHVTTGSILGHSTIALWDENDGELYVAESQGAWYWPKDGIQRNKWEDWIQWAKNAEMNVVLIPLKEEFREIFDLSKAWARFYELQGLDYGFRNFLFGGVDTLDQNTPDTIDISFIAIVFQIIERFFPSSISLILGEALNKRLDTNNLEIPELFEEIYKRDTTLEEVLIMVEQENWVYSNGPNYVCSSFVFAILKSAGVFGDLKFNPQEQTPKDLYFMNIWDFSGQNIPKECEEDTKKHNLKICQIYGKVVMRINDDPGTLDPYENMGETCPTSPPDYSRTPGC